MPVERPLNREEALKTRSTESAGDRESIFKSNLPIGEKLERARTELLDLSARDRLRNMPRLSKAARTVEVIDEKSVEVFRLLTRGRKALTFLPGRSAKGSDGDDASPDEDEADLVVELAQPEDNGVDERGVANRHSDTRLQTRMTFKGLWKRLLDLYSDVRTLDEEQGTNILFLALGLLKWIDPNRAIVRYAPLILLAVRLEHAKAGKLVWRGEDASKNLSLELPRWRAAISARCGVGAGVTAARVTASWIAGRGRRPPRGEAADRCGRRSRGLVEAADPLGLASPLKPVGVLPVRLPWRKFPG